MIHEDGVNVGMLELTPRRTPIYLEEVLVPFGYEITIRSARQVRLVVGINGKPDRLLAFSNRGQAGIFRSVYNQACSSTIHSSCYVRKFET